MLARVAENLYWMGRYLERSEYSNRFVKVQYFSTVESPMTDNKDFALRSILFMMGTTIDSKTALDESVVWRSVLFNPDDPNSLLSIITSIRENARGIRNTISQELWKALNTWYNEVKKQDPYSFTSSDLFDFAEYNSDQIAVVKSAILNTLLHDDIYHFINLGKYIERGLQILRILRSKISDWEILSDNGVNRALLQFQLTILLKSLEAFDVHNKLYGGKRSQGTIFKMIFIQDNFPRSIKYTYRHIFNHLDKISFHPEAYQDIVNKNRDCIEPLLRVSDFKNQEKVIENIEHLRECLIEFHEDLTEMYFY